MSSRPSCLKLVRLSRSRFRPLKASAPGLMRSTGSSSSSPKTCIRFVLPWALEQRLNRVYRRDPQVRAYLVAVVESVVAAAEAEDGDEDPAA